MEHLKYPIGKFDPNQKVEDYQLAKLMKDIAILPTHLSDQIAGMRPELLNKKYREGGWTGKQVIHHLADSHMHAHIRFILALTENNPQIKPYNETLVAELPFINQMTVEVSLNLLHALHQRWFFLLQSMQLEDFDKTYLHPQYNRTYTLRVALGSYAWHGKHHLAHLKLIK